MKKKLALVLAGVLALSSLTACGTKNSAKEESTPAASETLAADIVVIGAGGAGMSAAIQANQDGATNVVVLEKMAQTGGNTTRATGGLNASETKYQDAKGIKDSNDLFFEDTMKGGKNLNDEALVRTLVDNSNAAVEWVNEMGADLSVVAMFGGASVERIHRPGDTSAVGPVLVKTFNAQLEERNIPVLLETTAKEILTDDNGAVTGVKISDSEGEKVIECKAVIIATGGFGANLDMVVELNSDLEGMVGTNHAGATGDGIELGTNVGAATVDLDQIQIHPTVDPETGTLYTEGVRGNGAILVNTDGNRFVNEILTRDVVSAAILEQPGQTSWMVFDQSVRESLSAIEKYVKAGLTVEADSIEELAEKIGVNAENLKATMTTYAEAQASGEDKEFGRTDMPLALTNGKFYAAKCAPGIHHTMGGLKINTEAQVLNADGAAITGLFAAGEVTGGVHGANRLGGNAVCDIVVFGRISGESAAKFVAENGGNTEATIVVEKADAEVTPEVQGNFVDGTYTGTGKGNNGDIKVEVTVKDGSIVKIDVLEHSETDGIYDGALANVVPAMIKKQTTEVDTVSGASNSSKGLMAAVADAVKDATK